MENGFELADMLNVGPRPFEPIEKLQGEEFSEEGVPVDDPTPDDFATRWNCVDPPLSKAEGLRQHRPTILASWNRKGGVGKSTTTLQLGYALAKEGCKTLMVDMDSQQDLTVMTFRRVAQEKGFSDVQEFLKSELPQGAGGKAKRTCASLAEAVRFTLKTTSEVAPAVPHDGTRCGLLKPYPFPVQSANSNGIQTTDNLYLVQGGMEFDEAEAALKTAYGTLDGQQPSRNGPGAFFHAIWNASYDIKAKVVILDLSPALSTTNEVMLMHSDYWFAPCDLSMMSEKNLQSIGQNFGDWYQKYQEDGTNGMTRAGYRDVTRGLTKKRKPFRVAELPLPDIGPKFLGICINNYQAKNKPRFKRDSSGVPTSFTADKETFSSASRVKDARRLLNASTTVQRKLQTPKYNFSLEDEVFERPNDPAQGITGLGEFRHKKGSCFYPQPGILSRVARGTQYFDSALRLVGKPFAALDEIDIRDIRVFFGRNSPKEITEDVAHYARVFQDMAKFIKSLSVEKNKECYNFVFDPQAAGGPTSGIAPVTHGDGRPKLVEGYPNEDTDPKVQAKRNGNLVWE